MIPGCGATFELRGRQRIRRELPVDMAPSPGWAGCHRAGTSGDPCGARCPRRTPPGIGPAPSRGGGRHRPRGRVGLHLEGDQAAAGELGEQVDLGSTLLLAQVIQARPGGRKPELGPELGDDEGFEKVPDEVAAPKHEVGVETQDGTNEGRLDEMALGHQHEALEPVRRPGWQRLDHQQIREQALVHVRRPAVDPGCAEERPLVHDTGRVERVGLEVAAQATSRRRGCWASSTWDPDAAIGPFQPPSAAWTRP